LNGKEADETGRKDRRKWGRRVKNKGERFATFAFSRRASQPLATAASERAVGDSFDGKRRFESDGKSETFQERFEKKAIESGRAERSTRR
jgi:hypothetical protein